MKEVRILEKLVGKEIEKEPKQVVEKVKENKRTYKKRTEKEIQEFIREWEDPMSVKEDVAEVFGFSSKITAGIFYRRHKKEK